VANEINYGLGSDTDLTSVLRGARVIWADYFTSYSRRTGGYASGLTTGYNAPGSTGIWSSNGENYMTSPSAVSNSGDSWSYLINDNYNWAATDPSFPGLTSLAAGGLVLKSTGSYSAIRNSLPLISGNVPYLGAQVSTASAVKLTTPFICRAKFTLDTMGAEDFPAIWLLNEHYALDINNAAFRHREIDLMERFGNDTAANHIASTIHTDPGTGSLVSSGGDYDTGSAIGPSILNEVVAFVSDGMVLIWFNGVLRQTLYPPSGTAWANDRFHVLLEMRIGRSWKAYPATATDAQMTVRSVEFLRPFTLTNDLIP
jgi:hypothetical protein